jgi:hypothetical protein
MSKPVDIELIRGLARDLEQVLPTTTYTAQLVVALLDAAEELETMRAATAPIEWGDGAEIYVTVQARALEAQDVLGWLSDARHITKGLVKRREERSVTSDGCSGAVRVSALWSPDAEGVKRGPEK